jgi:hypothetical protein
MGLRQETEGSRYGYSGPQALDTMSLGIVREAATRLVLEEHDA